MEDVGQQAIVGIVIHLFFYRGYMVGTACCDLSSTH
ncbi:hypothetical protein BSAF29S_03020 [Bacillus safensis subsp. safensis]